MDGEEIFIGSLCAANFETVPGGCRVDWRESREALCVILIEGNGRVWYLRRDNFLL